MYLESSKDILFLILAFCALWFTLFMCWALWYVIRMLRDASNIVGELRDKLHAIEEAIRGIREKLEHSASYLGVVAAGVKMAIEMLNSHKDKVAEKAQEVATKFKKKMKKAKGAIKDFVEEE